MSVDKREVLENPRSVNKGGRPRHEYLDAEILAATLDLLGEGGLSAVSFYSVARRIGVSRQTVTLRWPERDDMVTAALATTAEGFEAYFDAPYPEAIRELVGWWARGLHEPRARSVLLRLMADRDVYPEIWDSYQRDVAQPAMRRTEEMLSGLQRGGLIRADVDVAVVRHLVVGTLWVHDGPPDAAFLQHLVDLIERMVSP